MEILKYLLVSITVRRSIKELLRFKIIGVKDVTKVRNMDNHALIYYINRRNEFKPNPEVVARYDELLRRYGTNPNAVKFAMQGSNYDANYRRRINRDSKAIKTLREITIKAKTDPVYLVKETDKPDISILINMAEIMAGAGVW